MPDILVDSQPVDQPPRRAVSLPRWVMPVVVIAVLVFVFRDRLPTPGPGPMPYEPGDPRVMFVLDDELDISRGQGQVAISQVIQKLCEELDVEYRRYDVRDDLAKEDVKWQEMMTASKGDAPAMTTIDASGSGEIREIPESVDAASAIVKDLK